MAARANIVIDAGSDFSTTITVRDTEGEVQDLAGYTAAGQIRKSYSSLTATSFTTVFENPRQSGQLTIKLSRDLTANMEPGKYVYDVEITDLNDVRSRLVEGIVTVTPQVTLIEGT
jgi:hypothetical protein